MIEYTQTHANMMVTAVRTKAKKKVKQRKKAVDFFNFLHGAHETNFYSPISPSSVCDPSIASNAPHSYTNLRHIVDRRVTHAMHSTNSIES